MVFITCLLNLGQLNLVNLESLEKTISTIKCIIERIL